MNILVVYAYPNDVGYNSAIFEGIIKEFRANNEVRVHNLYEENFDPVLRFDSVNKRRDLKSVPEMEVYRENILWSDHVVFVFPIWWGGMPAILKGFIDRVFSKGFGYDYVGNRPVGLLKNKTSWIVSTNDTPAIISKLFQDDFGKVLEKQVLKMCGFSKVKRIAINNVKNSTKSERLQHIEKLKVLSRNLKE